MAPGRGQGSRGRRRPRRRPARRPAPAPTRPRAGADHDAKPADLLPPGLDQADDGGHDAAAAAEAAAAGVDFTGYAGHNGTGGEAAYH